MLSAAIRYKLHFGPYRTPRIKRGAVVEDEIRGEVTIVGLTDAKIPWPIGKKTKGKKSYLVYGGLARAIRRESAQAVCYWWKVSPKWVTDCRRALGAPWHNEGTVRLKVQYADTPPCRRARRLGNKRAQEPEAMAKRAAARRGQKMPMKAREAISAALRGRPKSIEHRRKMSLAKKRSESQPFGRPWTKEEDLLARCLPIKVVAERTGRTIGAVQQRRCTLGATKRRRLKNAARVGRGRMSRAFVLMRADSKPTNRASIP